MWLMLRNIWACRHYLRYLLLQLNWMRFFCVFPLRFYFNTVSIWLSSTKFTSLWTPSCVLGRIIQQKKGRHDLNRSIGVAMKSKGLVRPHESYTSGRKHGQWSPKKTSLIIQHGGIMYNDLETVGDHFKHIHKKARSAVGRSRIYQTKTKQKKTCR